MKILLLAPLFLMAAFTLLAPPARAALSTADFQTSGDGLVTFDDQTGLYWLDLSVSNGLSRNAIDGGAGGIAAAGFTHATMDQVGVFWNHGGFPLIQEVDDPNDALQTPSTPAIEAFVGQIGQTGPTQGIDTWFAQARTVGDAQNCVGPTPQAGCPYQSAIIQRVSTGFFLHLVDGSTPRVSSDAFGNVAHWLVSTAAPTPVLGSTWGTLKQMYR